MTGTLAALTAAPIKAPSIEYGQLSPMLVVFGAAVAGVLAEALVPRPVGEAWHLSRWAGLGRRSAGRVHRRGGRGRGAGHAVAGIIPQPLLSLASHAANSLFVG